MPGREQCFACRLAFTSRQSAAGGAEVTTPSEAAGGHCAIAGTPSAEHPVGGRLPRGVSETGCLDSGERSWQLYKAGEDHPPLVTHAVHTSVSPRQPLVPVHRRNSSIPLFLGTLVSRCRLPPHIRSLPGRRMSLSCRPCWESKDTRRGGAAALVSRSVPARTVSTRPAAVPSTDFSPSSSKPGV